MELVALRPLEAGQEATISYTGPQGLTNQRLMAQYGEDGGGAWVGEWISAGGWLGGATCRAAPVCHAAPSQPASLIFPILKTHAGFVPTGGNRADRLQFAACTAGSSGGGSLPPGVQLSLDRMQAGMGDGERMAAAMSGKDGYAYAALKSLPFAAEESAASELSQQLALAERVAAELAGEASAWPTSLEEDAALVLRQRQAAAGAGGSAWDARLAAALDYRLQRKALLTTARLLLGDFISPVAGRLYRCSTVNGLSDSHLRVPV